MSGLRRAPLLVKAEWVKANLGKVRVFDSSWYLPAMQRNAYQEYLDGHIPSAHFFDIDEISDKSSSLPHMLPPKEKFEDFVGGCGVSNDDHVVVYDGKGIFSACRVFWTFRVRGGSEVALMIGMIWACHWYNIGIYEHDIVILWRVMCMQWSYCEYYGMMSLDMAVIISSSHRPTDPDSSGLWPHECVCA